MAPKWYHNTCTIKCGKFDFDLDTLYSAPKKRYDTQGNEITNTSCGKSKGTFMGGQSVTALPRSGRPTAEHAKARHSALLDKALDMFLEKGFEQTTLNSIAREVRMTKRTIYGLYATKEALFEATVRRAIERNLVPRQQLEELEKEDLEATLRAVAHMRIEAYLSETGMRLQRIINAETHRFPGLALMVYEESTGPTIEFLTRVLTEHRDSGEIHLERPEADAAIFLSMAVGTTVRGMMLGSVANESRDVDKRIDHCVHLFLNGLRRRE